MSTFRMERNKVEKERNYFSLIRENYENHLFSFLPHLVNHYGIIKEKKNFFAIPTSKVTQF